MPLVESTILEVSRQLNDQESGQGATPYLRWPYNDLLEYFNDALVQVTNLCPHLVTEEYQVGHPGSGNRVPLPSNSSGQPALELLMVHHATASGTQYPLVRVDEGFVKTFSRPATKNPSKYRPFNWSYEAASPSFFRIYPEVLPGAPGMTFFVTCRYPAPVVTVGYVAEPFQGKYHQPIVSWMQARAYEVDQESESSLKLAMMHRADFFKMMKAIIDTDQALHAGAYRAPGRIK